MRCVLTFLFLLITCLSYSRNTDTTVTTQGNIPISDQALHKLSDQYGSLDKSIKDKTGKMLEQLQKSEAKLQKKVAAKDSVKAKEIFANSNNRYQALQAKLQQPIDKTVANPLREYIPNVDSLQTALRFLERNSNKLSSGQLQQIQALSSQLQQLQGRLQQSNEIQTFIRQREQQLKDQLSQYGGDVSKQLLGMNKQVYYYQQQLVEYKALLKNKQQMEQKTLSVVRELPAFQSFMQKNSYLAQLFPSAENYSSSQALSTMQLRSQVQTMIQSRLGIPVTTNAADPAAGSSGEPEQFMGQQIGQAQSVMSRLKDKISNSGGSSSEITMPDFSPNGQKTKSFFSRLEYGFNIQSQRSNYLLPTTSQLAATIGYKLNDKATIGLGSSFNVGWGNSLNHIQISNQGVSMRSFIDIKAKGSVWITGGYEYEYFSELINIKNWDAWQKSALIGITKKYKIGKQAGNMQLLYDLLSKDHVPKTQSLIFRVGYTF